MRAKRRQPRGLLGTAAHIVRLPVEQPQVRPRPKGTPLNEKQRRLALLGAEVRSYGGR